ncbi:hypothetical protein [Rubrobacter indicoceani]|uniref:sulfotransferase-like domain-containing protein n=1 Tax=Rubrobacter indicoceani TaxID=2051957 RepID=UPI0019698457|nr:hypothetical protein [Rubrobacter indicoceani]
MPDLPGDALRLSVWSGPRNVSTALMYSFRQRPDTSVVDEPFYGHYLAFTGVDHPGRAEVLGDMETGPEAVIRDTILGGSETRVRFFKNMAHHLAGLDRSFLDQVTNVLLVRDPRLMLPSLAEKIPTPVLRDTGLLEQVEILEYLLASGDAPIVLDSATLLRDPRAVLSGLCCRLGLPFYGEMLSWPAGPKPEDGIWAKYWYRNVHASTGFAAPRKRPPPVPKRLEPLLLECLELYGRLEEHAIPAGG